MAELTVTAKGQVTFRKDLLRHLGVGPGDKIHVDVMPDGALSLQAAHPGKDIDALFGLLESPNNPVLTLDEIKEATAQAWSRKR